METTEKFESWSIVELFGHNKIAGKCSEQNIAGNNMLRVDVPETERNPAFTRFLGHAAIYAINPVTEEVAIHWAKMLQSAPISAWDVREFIEKNKLALNAPIPEDPFDTEVVTLETLLALTEDKKE